MIQLFHVFFSYSVCKYPYKINVGRDLKNNPPQTLPTDWRSSWGQRREVAAAGLPSRAGSTGPSYHHLPEEDSKTHSAEGFALNHTIGFGAKPGLSHPGL